MRRLYWGAGLAGLFFCLVAYIPAPLLYPWLRDDWGPQIQVFGLSGNLWQGQAASLSLAGITLQSVEWRWRPQALLLGRISHSLGAETANGSLHAVLSNPLLGSTLRISAFSGSLPIEQLGPGLGLPVSPFSGDLEFDLARLHLRAGRPVLAEGSLDFSSLGFRLTSPETALGSYRATLATRQETIQLQIESTDGQLEASGTGQISPAGQYSLELKLRPRATAPASVVSLLQPLGRADAEGWYRLRRSGSF
jgi:autotransporter translocation and assembly factor TamB